MASSDDSEIAANLDSGAPKRSRKPEKGV
jgi:hypothetical protein